MPHAAENCYENALAERVNGILKTEYLATGSNAFSVYGDEVTWALARVDSDGNLSNYYYLNDWPIPETGNSAERTISRDIILTAGEYRLIEVPIDDYEYDSDGNIISPPGISIFHSTTAGPGGEHHFTLDGATTGVPLIEQFEIGGLRIASVTNYNNDTSFISKKSYSYELPDNNSSVNSSGKLMNDLIYFSKGYGFYSYDPREYSASEMRFTSNNNLRVNASAQGSHIGYSNTQEYILDEDDNVLGSYERSYFNSPNYFKKVSFTNLYNQAAATCTLPENAPVTVENTIVLDAQPFTYGYVNGNIIKEEVYSADNRKMSQGVYGYQTLIANPDEEYFISVMGVHVGIGNMDNQSACYAPGYKWPDDLNLNHLYTFPASFWKKTQVSNIETFEFLEDKQYRTLEETNYDLSTHHLKRTKSYISEYDVSMTENFYPYNYLAPTAVQNDLINKNRLTDIQEVKTYREGQLINTRKYNYDFTSTSPIYNFVESIDSANATETLEEDISYEVFDDDGNLLQVRSRDGTPVTYVWGYNNQHIIAKVENKTWADISSITPSIISASNNDDDTCLAGEGCDEDSLLTALDAFRNNSLLADAMVTTYTYNPLIGVSSIKDPSDNIVYYIYDSTNRLTEIRDVDGFLIQKFDYNITDDLIPLIVYDEDPGGNTDGDGDNCVGPFCETGFKTLSQFKSEDRTLDENGNKHLFGNIIIGEYPSNNIFNISYKILPYGGTGNYEYRWRKSREDYGNKTTIQSWSTPYDCTVNPNGEIEVICEIEDTVTGKTFEARLKHVVICQN